MEVVASPRFGGAGSLATAEGPLAAPGPRQPPRGLGAGAIPGVAGPWKLQRSSGRFPGRRGPSRTLPFAEQR
eukprot:6793538-Pyramimonas_sp.AAC.1